jgi:hypothetical protein
VRGMVAYLLPLLGVPVGTLLAAGVYVMLVLMGILSHPGPGLGVQVVHVPTMVGSSGARLPINVPAVLPEAGIEVALVSIPFLAACCMFGLQRSTGSKGTIGSVVATVGIVGVIAGIIGLCAFKSGETISILGPVMAALSPATTTYSGVFVEYALVHTVDDPDTGLAYARMGLFIGSLVAAGVYVAVVYGLRANVVSSFDMTVRRLAGMA